MVLSQYFFCPTKVIEGHAAHIALEQTLQNRSWGYLTSNSWIAAGSAQQISATLNKPLSTIGRVTPNPSVSDIFDYYEEFGDVDCIVALGGGSVIDAAKGIAALQGLQGDKDALMAHLTTGEVLEFSAEPPSILAIPTTSGTGAEITRWGTIWGDDGIKFSVNDMKLYPEIAILDPVLTLSMPTEISLSTGLDALSHACESIWNRKHSSISDLLAVKAIRDVHENLPRVLSNPQDLDSRRAMQLAAVLAGLAMGTTQTALAHSISYPFTSRFGVPHGLACSFTLPEIARFNFETHPERISLIGGAFGCVGEDVGGELENWLTQLGMKSYLSKYVSVESLDSFGDALITRARAANNIREAQVADAKDIAAKSLQKFTG